MVKVNYDLHSLPTQVIYDPPEPLYLLRTRILYMGRDIWRLRRREALWYYTQVQGVFQDPYSSFNPIHVVERSLLQTLYRLGG